MLGVLWRGVDARRLEFGHRILNGGKCRPATEAIYVTFALQPAIEFEGLYLFCFLTGLSFDCGEEQEPTQCRGVGRSLLRPPSWFRY
jgi:hypothetical protein